MTEETTVRRGFWRKVRKVAGKVPFVPDAVAMYYCMLDAKTPVWVKAAVAAALAYFVVPLDAIPDILVPLGYTDDAAVIAATLKTVGDRVTDEHRTQAREALR